MLNIRFQDKNKYVKENDMSDEDYVLQFAGDILKNDTSLKLSAMDTLKIVQKNYAGNGYFSWDGILDDLAELIDYPDAREILGNC